MITHSTGDVTASSKNGDDEQTRSGDDGDSDLNSSMKGILRSSSFRQQQEQPNSVVPRAQPKRSTSERILQTRHESLGAKPVINGVDEDDDEDRTSCRAVSRQIIIFAVSVWFGQILIAVLLKKFGIIQHNLNDIVVQRVVPTLQQQLEQNEWMAPLFTVNENVTQWLSSLSSSNESAASYYWNRLTNDTLSVGHLMKERERPGFQLAKQGARGSHPLVMIPGFVTSGLEVWEGKECARKYFRQRMWGGMSSARQFLMERECFFQHMTLDPHTGMDPEGIRLRASQGFEAADYFMPSYWVWAKILENLADVGYDGSLMSMESYDWRLAFPLLEKRDGYLTKLKFKIESYKKTTGKKVIISSHSLGAILVHYFFAWVTSPEGGKGGKRWVHDHIHSYVNIAGAQLGVAKAAPALLSGEMRDTVVLGPLGTIVEQFIGRKLRRDLWASWGSLWSMLPKGGDAIWGIGADLQHNDSDHHGLEQPVGKDPELDMATNEEKEGDDSKPIPNVLMNLLKKQIKRENVPFLVMTHNCSDTATNKSSSATTAAAELDNNNNQTEWERRAQSAIDTYSNYQMPSLEQTIEFLREWGASKGPKLSSREHVHFDRQVKRKEKIWHDLTLTPLPYAPDLKIYCLYGVGLETERAYFYKKNDEDESNESQNAHKARMEMPFVLDTSIDDPAHKIKHGIKYVDGDHSVPLLSLGYMCADGWRRKSTGLNPSNTKVITREYANRNEFDSSDPMRGGPYSADHVDILGNLDMITDLMKIVTGEELEDKFESEILNIAKAINEHGGIRKR